MKVLLKRNGFGTMACAGMASKMTAVLCIGVSVLLLSSQTVLASGSKHKVTIETNTINGVGYLTTAEGVAREEEVKFDVVFTAFGCAEVRECGDRSVTFACAKRTIGPGETAAYAFKAGTSERISMICGKTKSFKGSSGRSLKHIHVCYDGSGHVGALNALDNTKLSNSHCEDK